MVVADYPQEVRRGLQAIAEWAREGLISLAGRTREWAYEAQLRVELSRIRREIADRYEDLGRRVFALAQAGLDLSLKDPELASLVRRVATLRQVLQDRSEALARLRARRRPEPPSPKGA